MHDYPPAYEKFVAGESLFETVHMAVASDDGIRQNCVVCYREGIEMRRGLLRTVLLRSVRSIYMFSQV
jgi:hypothetical protein